MRSNKNLTSTESTYSKVDVEGSEKEIFSTADSWLSFVDVICIELHDRFKSGCSRSFFKAVEDFPIELHRSEDVLVARAESRLIPIRQLSKAECHAAYRLRHERGRG